MNRKAISLLSGGLDSTLATKLVIDQGIEVVALHFTSVFASRRERERGFQAVKTARELGIKLITIDKGPEYFEVVKHPEHGYGKNMNPCIDCRIFMLKKTAAIMEDEGASFVITGEVLGQRPMSQRRHTIELIEKASGLAGIILRPLTAKHFPPTLAETEGIVDREKLLDLSGRSRTPQYKLVEQFNLKEFGCPGGGCLLTDQTYSKKLRDLLAHEPDFTRKDLDLLNIGRHFRLEGNRKLIVGRDQGENEQLKTLCSKEDTLFYPTGFKGPHALLKGEVDEGTIALAANIIGYYGKNTSAMIDIELNSGTPVAVSIPKTDMDVDSLRL